MSWRSSTSSHTQQKTAIHRSWTPQQLQTSLPRTPPSTQASHLWTCLSWSQSLRTKTASSLIPAAVQVPLWGCCLCLRRPSLPRPSRWYKSTPPHRLLTWSQPRVQMRASLQSSRKLLTGSTGSRTWNKSLRQAKRRRKILTWSWQSHLHRCRRRKDRLRTYSALWCHLVCTAWGTAALVTLQEKVQHEGGIITTVGNFNFGVFDLLGAESDFLGDGFFKSWSNSVRNTWRLPKIDHFYSSRAQLHLHYYNTVFSLMKLIWCTVTLQTGGFFRSMCLHGRLLIMTKGSFILGYTFVLSS